MFVDLLRLMCKYITRLSYFSSPGFQIDLFVIATSIIFLNLFTRKQYPTFYFGRSEKRSHVVVREKIESLCCSRKAKTGKGKDSPIKDDMNKTGISKDDSV
jgi:hypothetical protein